MTSQNIKVSDKEDRDNRILAVILTILLIAGIHLTVSFSEDDGRTDSWEYRIFKKIDLIGYFVDAWIENKKIDETCRFLNLTDIGCANYKRSYDYG